MEEFREAAQESNRAYHSTDGEVNGTSFVSNLLQYGGKQSLLISFEGTNSGDLRDIVRDCDIRSTEMDISGCSVHSGFYRSTMEILPLVIQEINSFPLIPNIILSGHSLGGAIATLMALELKVKGHLKLPITSAYTHLGGGERSIKVITFGCPMVGDDSFVHTYKLYGLDKITTRFAYRADIVTHLPPGSSFQHVGELIYINKAGKFYREADFRWALAGVFFARSAIEDHSMENYLEKLMNGDRL